MMHTKKLEYETRKRSELSRLLTQGMSSLSELEKAAFKIYFMHWRLYLFPHTLCFLMRVIRKMYSIYA